MRSPLLLIAAAVMLTAPLVNAQEGRARQRWPDSSSQRSGGGGGERPAPRAAEPRSAPREQSPQREQSRARERAAEPRVAPQPEARAAAPAEDRAAEQGQRRAVPRDRGPREGQVGGAARGGGVRADRDGGANPRPGYAVPRRGPAPSARERYDARRYNGRPVYVYPRSNVYVYYNYPRRYFPFGYSGYGPGYYYYDRGGWFPYSAYDPSYRFDYYRSGYPTGEVRIDVDQTFAEVWVDGYYAGTVDDFDGIFQGLTLEEGTYNIEIVAPGYEPLIFDIRIQPGERITYRGDLLRARQ